MVHRPVGASPTLDERLLERFARKNPIGASTRLVLEQLFAADAINAVFEKHRVERYTSKILFVTIVQVMLAVVFGKVDSAHAAMQRHGDALGAAVTAFYNKLNDTEPQVATALVAHSVARGNALLASMGGLRMNRSPDGVCASSTATIWLPRSVVWRCSGASLRDHFPARRWWPSTSPR